MKYTSENDLHALSTWALGLAGTSLLLIPSHFNMAWMGWGLPVIGMASYSIAVAAQLLFVLKPKPRQALFYRGLSAFMLFILAALFIQSEYLIEAFIFGGIGIIQLSQILPVKAPWLKTDPLNLALILIGLSSGIALALSKNLYEQVNIAPYKVTLVLLFLVTAAFEIIRRILFSDRWEAALSRLQIMPWVGWGLIFAPTRSAAHLFLPALLVITLLFSRLLPWERLSLPENDILGTRAVKIGYTLKATLLIFLSALLGMMDIVLESESTALITARNATFLFFCISASMLYYEITTIVTTVNGLIIELTHIEQEELTLPTSANQSLWNSRLARYIRPFTHARDILQIRINAQSDQIKILTRQLANEKKRNHQATLLLELSQQLESQIDQPVAAQLAVNSLERALNCSLVCLYLHEPDQKEFMLLAAAGRQMKIVEPEYRQSVTKGVMGRAARQRKTQILNDIRLDKEYISFENENSLSAIIVPLIFNGYINGMLKLTCEKINGFNSIDIWLAESVAAELTHAWERSRYHQRLMNLVETGSQLSAMIQPKTTVREVAMIAKEILQARFIFIQIHLGQERNFTQSATSGDAPRLQKSLESSKKTDSLIQAAFHAVQPFRVRDVRKYSPTTHLDLDHSGLRSMIAIPIRWHRLNIGAILAFGKQNEVFFNENDQSLAELLSLQAAGAFESAWLQQELRDSLQTTSLLYRLSTQIIQAENLQNAAVNIAQTAHKIAKSSKTGIILLDLEGKIIAETQIDSEGIHNGIEHPMDMVKDVMNAGRLIYLAQENTSTRACLPIQTPTLKYGILWMDISEDQGHTITNPNDLQVLVNQTAIALERSALLVESRLQAKEIKAAYNTLETTYDQTLAALMSALDARDRETEGHSLRVSHLTAKLGKLLNFSHEQLKVLERGSLLHDIGKIGISDTILHKPGPLNEEEWIIMRKHPDIGAKIVTGIPFLQETIPLIRHHQERWNGSGYPDGLRGEEIPILARMFAIVDAFDALTSNRPYRQKISEREAVDYLCEEAGVLFDPQIVAAFSNLMINSQSDASMTE